MEIKKNEESKTRYICQNCLKDFGNKKSNYLNHQNKKNGCKSDINNKMEEMKNTIIKLKEELEEKENDIIKLKEENERLKQQVVIYNDNRTTNHNYILQINNYKDTKYEGNINNLIKYIGKSIYLNTIKNVFLNKEKPENHNIYVADKNRGIIKIWNEGIWQSKNMIIIDEIINNIVEYFNLSIEEIKQDKNRYEKLKKTIINKVNYIQMCDLNYLDDLEDDEDENKERIERCKDFRKMVYDEIIILLHDNKNMVKESHKKIKTKIN